MKRAILKFKIYGCSIIALLVLGMLSIMYRQDNSNISYMLSMITETGWSFWLLYTIAYYPEAVEKFLKTLLREMKQTSKRYYKEKLIKKNVKNK